MWHHKCYFNSLKQQHYWTHNLIEFFYADDPTKKWGVRPHQVFDWREGLRGRGVLRGPGWLRGEWHTGDPDQPVHVLQGLPIPPHVWQRPDAHTVWERHLSSAASGVHFVCKSLFHKKLCEEGLSWSGPFIAVGVAVIHYRDKAISCGVM